MTEKTVLITEMFYSVQGEGARIGVPSIFIRVFGCNLNCPGFGQPRNNIIPIEEMPHNKFDVSSVDKIENLPVFDIGCDSSAAWSKKYRHLSKSYTVDELLVEMKALFPKYGYTFPDIVITGGEPLLKKFQPFWAELFMKADKLFNEITFETNGTQIVGDVLADSISQCGRKFTFSVSPKLSLTGEKTSKTLKPASISSMRALFRVADVAVYLKFVIRAERDMDEIDSYCEEYRYHWADEAGGDLLDYPPLPVYVMPEGATVEGLKLTEKKVANIAMKHGVRFSPRLHCALFGNLWST